MQTFTETEEVDHAVMNRLGILMRHVVVSNGPLLLTVVCLLISVLWVLSRAVPASHGTFTYALDDPYIHMATAKNLVNHGVWGVTKYGFTSATSSILWPLLLAAGYLIFGLNDLLPLLMNIVLAMLLLWLFQRIIHNYTQRTYVTSVALLAVLFVTPLPALIFSGQEHVLQTLLTIAFVYLAARMLTHVDSSRRDQALLIGLGVLDVATRYEGLFTVFVVCLLFAARRKFKFTLLLGALSVVPVVLFGVISILLGSDFLPNSVVLKGKAFDTSTLPSFIRSLGDFGYTQLMFNPHILWLVVAIALILYVELKHAHFFSNQLAIMSAVFLGVTFLHLNLAATGWFYRYEAYLVALGLLVVVLSAVPHIPARLTFRFSRQQLARQTVLACLLLLVTLPFLERAVVSLGAIAPTMISHYRQQYQMAEFLNRFYGDKTVVLHDIGMVGYFSEVRQLDIWGLSSIEIVRASKAKLFSSKLVAELAAQKAARIAIIYPYYLDDYGGIPPTWVQVGEWTMEPGGELTYPTIRFYALGPAEIDSLIAHLREFAPQLPQEITQSGRYTETQH